MKNKNIFLKIYIPFLIICFITFIILSILGKKNRVGYLGEFKFDEYHIENTLQLNGFDIDETKKLFTIDNILDNDALTNYIFTNEAITNYSYGFRLKYYDKVFRNSDIYGVYIDTNKLINDNNFIKSIKTDGNGSPFGNLISYKIIDFEKIDNVNYTLAIKNKIINTILWLLIITISIYFFTQFDKIIYYIKQKKLVLYNFYISYDAIVNNNFFIISLIITLLLMVFHFWLLRPGYFAYYDDSFVFAKAVDHQFQNWFPVIIQIFQSTLNKLFGYHTFYIFLVNIICWYIGLYFIVISVYKKLHSKKALLLFLLSFLANIFFMNTTHNKDVTAIMYLWLIYSIVFFIISFEIKNKQILIPLSIILTILLICSLLWRHSMIVTIYPIFILFTYMILKNKFANIKLYAISFISMMLIFAFLLIFIFKINPYIWIKDSNMIKHSNDATKHLFMLQIVGIAAISNDDSLIPDDWYFEGKDFEYTKNLYVNDRVNADLYKDDVFKLYKIDNLKEVWIKYILKHPISYFKHIINYMNVIFRLTTPILNDERIQSKSEMFGFSYYYDNSGITFTPLRKTIYNILYYTLLEINILVFIITAIVIFFISGLTWIFKSDYRSNMLLLVFCSAFASFATSMIVGLFTPLPMYRYIYPVIPMSIISLIGFITFVYDRGGFKKFIKGLIGNNE
ncbi:hypothetical protein [Brachyspira innocens]|uniref:hypothetical protein n=1 Tax=Brachyspira innocens TaxID=13264 RepID=UPI0026EB8525|nr:hypothetical protein [Brachyspira innocens]